jgi:hypothetical protein
MEEKKGIYFPLGWSCRILCITLYFAGRLTTTNITTNTITGNVAALYYE